MNKKSTQKNEMEEIENVFVHQNQFFSRNILDLVSK